MNIRVLAVGKIKDAWLKEGLADFEKRLGKYAGYETVTVPEGDYAAGIEKALAEEAAALSGGLKTGTAVILLDREGAAYDTLELAEYFRELQRSGKNLVTVLIGGPHGADQSLKQKADLCLSFSKLTFTHQHIRLLLAEQLFRVFKILHNEKYHY